MATPGFLNCLRRELRHISSRRLYMFGIVAIPLLAAIFFVSLMDEGLPLKVPTAVVDLDQSQMSRQVTRSLNAMELVDITHKAESYREAMDMVQDGRIYGFFYIPENFERDALSGRTPTLSYYSNMTYYVPGTLAFKGFKTMAVTTSGAIVQTTLVSTGAVGSDETMAMLQPLTVDSHQPGNPWTNYSIYLSNSFIPGVIQLMVMLMTIWTICHEIKHGTSPRWIASANGSIVKAIFAKLAPQTLIFTVVTWACDSILWGWCHFPLNCPLWHMLLAGFLLVIASQGLALLITSVVPNLRLALSIASLTGILSFSIAAFSFPVDSMYGAVGIFSYILPVRYYFLIYVDQALNGIPLYYSRWFYIALILLFLAGLPLIGRIRRHALKPVYVQ